MNLRFNRYLYKSSKKQFMCTIYHSLFNTERAVDIRATACLTDLSLRSLMTVSLTKADRMILC